jgi:ferritin-like metal-binding protein YciE
MDQRAMELLEHGMRDMYDAEQRFAVSLDKMQRNADDKSLADGFRRHHDVTLNQVKRIEKAFRAIGKEPSKETCKAAKGLVDEYEGFVIEHRGGNGLLDAFAATAGLKVEHYEIATYRALVNLAGFCDQAAVADLLSKNLAEEEQAAAEMMSASTKLSAKLAGASAAKVAASAVGSAFDHARENTFNAIGGVRAVAGHAVDRMDSRRKKAKAKAKTRKAKTTARRTKTTAKRKVAARKPTKPTRKATRKPARKRTTASSRTTKRPTRKSTTARRKTSARKRPVARRRTSSR